MGGRQGNRQEGRWKVCSKAPAFLPEEVHTFHRVHVQETHRHASSVTCLRRYDSETPATLSARETRKIFHGDIATSEITKNSKNRIVQK